MEQVTKSSQPSASKHGEYMRPRHRNGFTNTIIFLVIIVSVLFIMSIAFRIQDITVEGNEHYTDEEIIRAIDIEQGDNLFFFDRFAAISRVFAKLPYIESVTVDRYLPNKVTITVEECKAMAYIVIGDENWTIDNKCKVLGKAAEGETESLIPIVGFDPGTLLIGEQLTTGDGSTEPVDYLAAVLTQIKVRDLAGGITRIDFSDSNDLVFYYTDIYTVHLGKYDRIPYKFGMFVSAASQLKSGDIGIMDLSDTSAANFTPR